MRAVLLTLILASYAMAILFGIVAALQLRSFAGRVPRLLNESQLGDMKRVVKLQMIAALVLMLDLIVPAVLFGVGFVMGWLGFLDILFILIPAGLVIALNMVVVRPIERQVQETPAATPELLAERKRIVEVWRHKPLPDW